jgi:hypothetical protein
MWSQRNKNKAIISKIRAFFQKSQMLILPSLTFFVFLFKRFGSRQQFNNHCLFISSLYVEAAKSNLQTKLLVLNISNITKYITEHYG